MYIYPGACLGVSRVNRSKPSDKNSATLVLAKEPRRYHTGFSSELSDESSHVPLILIPTRSKSEEQQFSDLPKASSGQQSITFLHSHAGSHR
jgi:hypothetical protein